MKPRLQHKTLNLWLDAVDRRILAALQEDASLTNVGLAAKVGLSPSPCLARVRQLEEGA
jgi:Lrp/AsnC family leucine-responsive transcriptional regulator